MHQRMMISGFGLLLLAVLLLAFGGCSDDKVPVPTNNTVVGSPDDPEFVVVQEQINNYLDISREQFAVGLDNIYQLPNDTTTVRAQHGATGPNDIVTYVYQDGWHITYVYVENLAFNASFRDSLTFKNDGVAIEDALGLDYLHYIRYWDWTDNNTEATHTNKSGHIDIEFSGLDTDIGTIAGSNNAIFEWNYISVDTVISAVFDIEVVLSDITIHRVPSYGWTGGCPVSGGYTMEIDESYSIEVGSANNFWVTSWDVAVTFEDGVAAVSVTRDNVVWSYTYNVCTSPV